MRAGRRAAGVAAGLLVALGVTAAPAGAGSPGPAECTDEGIELTGTVTPDEEKTYELVPFEVPDGTARIEVGYRWEPTEGGVIDLGVWDADGTQGPEAFRAWAGSRQGRLDAGTAPLVIAPDRNERTVVADAIEPGTWHIELGRAAVSEPLDWTVQVRCVAGEQAEPLLPDPVDPTSVARDQPGWYAGDFHLHGYHSSPDGPESDDMVASAVAAGLDIIPVTEYVTPAHWDHLGATQRSHPDVLLWPGREVITYFGHLVVLSETRSTVEHRVGFDGITVGDIQRGSVADGALVSLAHPRIFPPATFGDACRGCYADFLPDLDLDALQLVEVVTESSVAEVGGQMVPNPFVRPAVELWEQLLAGGHRLTAVSGSDDKQGDRYGATSTMVWADQLSRPAVDEGLRRGHAYVRGLGRESPEMELTATAPDGTTATFGDTLTADGAEMTVTVRGGDGQVLTIRRNGEEVERVPVSGDDFTHTVAIGRSGDEGPLGTFWGAEVLDTTRFPDTDLATVIANPVFLSDTPAPEPVLPVFAPIAEPDTAAGSSTSSDDDDGSGWAAPILATAAALALVAGGLLLTRRRRSSATTRI